MGNPKSALRQTASYILIAVLTVSIILIFRWAQKTLIPKPLNVSEAVAYPPPVRNVPTNALDSYPSPDSRYTSTPLPTASILSGPTPESTITPGPPPYWPTDKPWPPDLTKDSPTPTIPPSPFPTTAVSQITGGNPPDSVYQLWFAYYPRPDAQPKLWAIDVDEDHQQWGNSASPVDILIPLPNRGFEPGAILIDLFISLDSNWLVADYAYRGSLLVDLSSGSILYDSSKSPWRFFNWMPENQSLLIFSDQQFKILDPTSLSLKAMETIDSNYDRSKGEISWYAIAYSPDGKTRADAAVYPAIFGIYDADLVEVGLWDSESNRREPLAQIRGGSHGGNYVVEDSLKWSPDGKRLTWIANISNGKSEKFENQLWIADPLTGNSKILDTLGIPAEYNEPAIWSPDGRFIAALKSEETKYEKPTANNIHLIDTETGEDRQLTFFSGRKLSHLQWSPNGKWLTFAISMGDYGEIWAVDMESNQPFPLAGPALPDAPFSWVP